jgi:hypothetical protein
MRRPILRRAIPACLLLLFVAPSARAQKQIEPEPAEVHASGKTGGTQPPTVATRGVRYHQTYQIACHNCYDRRESGMSFAEALKRVHDVELDLHPLPRSGGGPRWAVSHDASPEVNDCGTPAAGADGLRTCLGVVAGWMRTHPGAPVLTVYLDMKAEWDDGHTPAGLDEAITQVIPRDDLFTPHDLRDRGAFATVAQAAAAGAWPMTDSLFGRVIFVLTQSKPKWYSPRRITTLDEYAVGRGDSAVAFVSPPVLRVRGLVSKTGYPRGFGRQAAKWVAFRNLDNGGGLWAFASVFVKRGNVVRVWWGKDWLDPTVCQVYRGGVQRMARKTGWGKRLCDKE